MSRAAVARIKIKRAVRDEPIELVLREPDGSRISARAAAHRRRRNYSAQGIDHFTRCIAPRSLPRQNPRSAAGALAQSGQSKRSNETPATMNGPFQNSPGARNSPRWTHLQAEPFDRSPMAELRCIKMRQRLCRASLKRNVRQRITMKSAPSPRRIFSNIPPP